jgi:hypothetical protein
MYPVLLLSLFGLLAIVVSIGFYFWVYKISATVKFYRKQGVTIIPGAELSLIGNAKQVGEFKEALKNTDKPLSDPCQWMIKQKYSENGVFDSKKHKVILNNFLGSLTLNICDPEMA